MLIWMRSPGLPGESMRSSSNHQEEPFSVLSDDQEGARLPHVKRVVETPSCRIPKLAKSREHVTRSQPEWFELQIGGKSGDVVMNPDRGKEPRV